MARGDTAAMTAFKTIIAQLQADILRLQGFRPGSDALDTSGLDFMNAAFPNGVFPTGCIHEFMTTSLENTSASGGFIAGLLSGIMNNIGTTVWISQSRKIFPPALNSFGVDPERFIFMNVTREKDILWVMEEALKCASLSAVIAEVRNLSFTESRRLQLAVEHSKVTGFTLRNAGNPGTTACVSRWQIKQLPSEPFDSLPGLGYPKWNVKLLRMRNGKPGEWNIEWKEGKFVQEQATQTFSHELQKETG